MCVSCMHPVMQLPSGATADPFAAPGLTITSFHLDQLISSVRVRRGGVALVGDKVGGDDKNVSSQHP